MREIDQEKFQDYPVFKGLQKPLEFMGLKGRYIYWAAATIGGALLSFLISYIIFGFLVGLILLTLILGFGGTMTFVKQHKGLHSKKTPKGVFIFSHSKHY